MAVAPESSFANSTKKRFIFEFPIFETCAKFERATMVKGADGVTELRRIVDTVRRMGPFDVLCLQEVAINFAEMGGGETVDQVAEIVALLPGYAPFYAPAVDLLGPGGQRQKFGDMILSRLPLLETATHSLPRPAEAGVIHMPRVAAVAVVETKHRLDCFDVLT